MNRTNEECSEDPELPDVGASVAMGDFMFRALDHDRFALPPAE
jgi:hypothetical protein